MVLLNFGQKSEYFDYKNSLLQYVLNEKKSVSQGQIVIPYNDIFPTARLDFSKICDSEKASLAVGKMYTYRAEVISGDEWPNKQQTIKNTMRHHIIKTYLPANANMDGIMHKWANPH